MDYEIGETTITVEYKLASEIAENGQTVWFVEWWKVTHVDGVRMDYGGAINAEDLENAILEWEA